MTKGDGNVDPDRNHQQIKSPRLLEQGQANRTKAAVAAETRLGYPNALETAISVFPRIAGTGSAIMGFLQYDFSALVIALIGILPHDTRLTMAIVIAGLIVLSLITGSLGSIGVRKNEPASTMS